MDISSVFSYIPATHSQMLAGVPITAILFDRDVLISPLSIREIQALNARMRQIYIRQHTEVIANVPPDIKKQIQEGIMEKAKGLTFEYGDGLVFLYTSAEAFCMVFSAYLRKSTPAVDEGWIKEKCCPLNQVSVHTVDLLKEIQHAVVFPYPKQQELPKKNEPELAKFFEDADAESLVRLFRGLADRYHYSIEQILDMTPYMCHCMLFMLPEEHRHYLEMDAIANKNKQPNTPQVHTPPAGSGVVQMTPEEYRMFRIQYQAKQKQKTPG